VRSEVPSCPTDGADTSPAKHALLISPLLQQTNISFLVFLALGYGYTSPDKNLVATLDRIKEYRIWTLTTPSISLIKISTVMRILTFIKRKALYTFLYPEKRLRIHKTLETK
jgi:hypothetical protein